MISIDAEHASAFDALPLSQRRTVQLGLWLVPESGGTYKSVKLFSDALEGRVYSFTFPESLKKASQEDYCKHLLIENGLLSRAYCVPSRLEMQKLKDDIVNANLLVCHSFWRWGAPWAMEHSKRARIPYWVVLHGALDPYVWRRNWYAKKVWFELYGRRVLKKASYVICSTVVEQLKVQAVVPDARCAVINWPVEQMDDQNPAEKRKRFRQKHGIADSTRCILCLGRIDPVKRVHELVRVFCRADLPRTVLVIAGPVTPSYSEEFETALVAHDPSRTKVKVVGPVFGEDKLDLSHAVDGYVSHSAKENFGFAAAEAMAAALPVILSRGHDINYEIAGVRCGWLLETESDGELKNALREFSQLPEEILRELGRNGRKWAREHLTFSGFCSKVKALAYRSIAEAQEAAPQGT